VGGAYDLPATSATLPLDRDGRIPVFSPYFPLLEVEWTERRWMSPKFQDYPFSFRLTNRSGNHDCKQTVVDRDTTYFVPTVSALETLRHALPTFYELFVAIDSLVIPDLNDVLALVMRRCRREC